MSECLKCFCTVLLTVFILTSCTENEAIMARFDIEGELNLFDGVRFVNTSANANDYFWDFGDGMFSTEKSPQHKYKLTGIYKVMLTAANAGLTNTVSKSIEVSAGKPSVSFSISMVNQSISGVIGEFKFTNNSTRATSFLWSFGDGTTSTEKNPIHSYWFPGTYKVKMTAFNTQQCDSTYRIFNVIDTVAVQSQKYSIDVDGDGVEDFKFYIASGGGITFSSSGIYVEPYNNEISVISGRPVRYLIGDRILNNSNFVNTRLNITYEYRLWDEYHGGGTTYYTDSAWVKKDFGYIGFRKTINNKSRIGWVKLKVSGMMNFKLISFRIPSETESLLIDK